MVTYIFKIQEKIYTYYTLNSKGCMQNAINYTKKSAKDCLRNSLIIFKFDLWTW